MSMTGISSFDNDYDVNKLSTQHLEQWNSREVRRENTQKSDWIAKQIHTNASAIQPMKGSIGGSVSASTDTDGNTKVEGEGHLSDTSDDGSKTSVEISISAEKGADGQTSGDAAIRIKYEKDFNPLKA